MTSESGSAAAAARTDAPAPRVVIITVKVTSRHRLRHSRRIHHWHPRATLSLQLLIPKQRTLPPLQAILLAEGTLNLTVQITSATPSITLSTTPANAKIEIAVSGK